VFGLLHVAKEPAEMDNARDVRLVELHSPLKCKFDCHYVRCHGRPEDPPYT
jgi:hypothetical protein